MAVEAEKFFQWVYFTHLKVERDLSVCVCEKERAMMKPHLNFLRGSSDIIHLHPAQCEAPRSQREAVLLHGLVDITVLFT